MRCVDCYGWEALALRWLGSPSGGWEALMLWWLGSPYVVLCCVVVAVFINVMAGKRLLTQCVYRCLLKSIRILDVVGGPPLQL